MRSVTRARHVGFGIGLRGGRESGQIRFDRAIQIEAALLHEHHHGCCGDDRLRQRRDVVHRIFVHIVGFAVALKLTERVNRELAVQSDREHAAGKGAVGNRAIEQMRRRFAGARSSRPAQAVASSDVPPRSCRRRVARCRAPSREFCRRWRSGRTSRAPRRVARRRLSKIRRATFSRSGNRSIRYGLPNESDDRWLSGGEQLVHERALIVGEADIALAIRDAHEERRNGDVIGVRRRKLQRADTANTEYPRAEP